jgi:hypothetical protein
MTKVNRHKYYYPGVNLQFYDCVFLHVACNYHYPGWVFAWKYLKQGFWGEICIYIRGLHSVHSGVPPVYYTDHATINSILQ